MQISASIIPFLITFLFSVPTALAAEAESECKPAQYLDGVEDEYVSPEVLRQTYDEVREYLEVQAADKIIVLSYQFSVAQGRAIKAELFNRWGLYLDTENFILTVRLGPQRTQLVLVSDTTELARLDFMLRSDVDTALVFASMFAPGGHMVCAEYTQMEQFFWGEIIEKMPAGAYPERFSIAME